jgi:hypothetical protein
VQEPLNQTASEVDAEQDPPRVFVPQLKKRRDRATGELVNEFDLSPAGKFGQMITILPTGRPDMGIEAIKQAMRRALSDFSDKDYLLLIGDPLVMATASITAANANAGRVRFLRWDKWAKAYTPIEH